MDFLFTPLPKSNFDMTDAQLVLWQRNAIFECDCDNLMNRRIESGLHSRSQLASQLPNLLRRPLIEQSGINMAIDRIGLYALNSDGNESPPVARRPRLLPQVAPRNSMEFFQEAALAELWGQGLGLRYNP